MNISSLILLYMKAANRGSNTLRAVFFRGTSKLAEEEKARTRTVPELALGGSLDSTKINAKIDSVKPK